MVVTVGALDRAPRFEMLERIGAGSHGVVYRAHDHQLRRDVAVKRFAHVLTDDPRAMHRIRREVNALARVSHPYVVTIHDLVMLPDGDGEESPHLVMELVDGTSVKQLLTDHGPSIESVRLVRHVLAALDACHRSDILHLDIKPANVLLTAAGDVRLVDFGISRAASDLTATIAGTPHYMSPEQYEGRVDRRSDVYSVACLLFETLTGRTPFPGPPAVQLMAHRSADRPDPREVDPAIPAGLVNVLHRAMAIDPDRRYASAADFAAALAPFESIGAAQAGPTVTAVVPSSRVRPEPAPAPSEPGLAWTTRTARTLATLALSAGVVALVPTLVWASTSLSPAVDHRPPVMDESTASAWWWAAVVLAVAFVAIGRRAYFRLLADAPRRALGTALGAAIRGSAVLAFPWYAAGVMAGARAYGLSTPELYGSWADVAWILMPLATLVLTWRALARLRFGMTGLLAFVLRLGAAALAAALFAAYPSLL